MQNMDIQLVYTSQRGTAVTDSVKVSQVFGKEHKNILQTIRNMFSSAENSAHVKWFYESAYQDAQGKSRPMFIMNRDGFSLLAMGLTGKKAMQFKVGFIEQFNRMESLLKNQVQTPAVPQTFADALRLAAEQADKLEKQQRVIEAQAPAVLFTECVKAAKNDILIGDMAKLLQQNGIKIGQNRLYVWLVENKFLICRKRWSNSKQRYVNNYMPSQSAQEKGLFRVQENLITTKPGEPQFTKFTCYVTGKGQEFFIQRFLYKRENKEQL